MRIQNIDIKNSHGVRSAVLDLETPINLFAGGNGAGKSSIAESVRMALGDAAVRVNLKKDYGALVTEGSKKGRVNVTVNGEAYGITLPDGKRYGPDDAMPAFLQYVLDPPSFSALDPNARRTELFKLVDCRINGKELAEKLRQRGHSDVRIEAVLNRLANGTGGFPAVADWAKEQARDAKASWKAITGEAYGDKKADGWKAVAPEFDPDALARAARALEDHSGKVEEAAAKVGRLQADHKHYANWLASQEKREEQAERLPALRKKLEREEKELSDWAAKVADLEARAGTGPRQGLVHDLARALDGFLRTVEPKAIDSEIWNAGVQAMAVYGVQHGDLDSEGDPEAASKLPEACKARDLMQRAAGNTRRDIAAAEAAAQEAQAEAPQAVSDVELNAAAIELSDLRTARGQLEQTHRAEDSKRMAAMNAEQDTRKAAEHHAAVGEWLALAESLSPDGIPGEMLASALAPINDRLRQSATSTGWMQVAIGADMTITANGRPYSVLAKSEKWRTDAMLAEAISHLSGLRMFLLDEADILEPAQRPPLMLWLEDLAQAGDVDTVLVFMTLKAAPSGLPQMITPHWIQGGVLADSEPVAA